MPVVSNSHRNTIFVEEAAVLSHQHVAGEQHIMRVLAPKTARAARPGTFAHLDCGLGLSLRRPLSIMRVDPTEGWVEFLYKSVGAGTRALAGRVEGDRINLLGPIGSPFSVRPETRTPVLIGGGVGIPPMIFLAERLRAEYRDTHPVVFMGSEVPFPFAPKPSEILVHGIASEAIACLPLLDDWGIPSRLASLQGYAGCFDGYVTDLARQWLSALSDEERARVQVFSCGPTPMLRATAAVAAEFDLPCQVCLEEFMACAVGGCAGCVVEVSTPNGPAMQRVCIDGPVFEAKDVFPSQ